MSWRHYPPKAATWQNPGVPMLEAVDASRSDTGARLPEGAVAAVTRSRAHLGLVRRDGLVGMFNPRLMRRLGFDAGDDLEGLAFVAFWEHSERADVVAALGRAAREGHARIRLGLSYLTGEIGHCEIAMSQAAPGVILIAFECPDP